MDIKEAIKIIKGLIRTAELSYNSNPLSKEGEHTATKALTLAISALEKREQDRWIPCDERLPEVKQRVLAQRKDGFMEVKVCIDGGHLAWFYSGIVAWRPLPEPYTEEEE